MNGLSRRLSYIAPLDSRGVSGCNVPELSRRSRQLDTHQPKLGVRQGRDPGSATKVHFKLE